MPNKKFFRVLRARTSFVNDYYVHTRASDQETLDRVSSKTKTITMCGPSKTSEVTTERVEVDKIPVSIHLIIFPLQIRRTDRDPFESTTRRQLANLREKVNDLRRENQMRSTSLEMALCRLEGLRRNVVELRQVRDKLKESVKDMKEKVKNFDKLYKEEVGPAKPERQKGSTITPQGSGLERTQAKKSIEARKDVTKSAKARVLRFIKCGFS